MNPDVIEKQDGSQASPPVTGSAFGDCPFCGTPTEPLSFCQSGYGVGPRLWCIRCANIECFAIGPVAPTVKEAEAKWRARPNESSSPDCCAEWTRSAGLIDNAWRAAKFFGFHYSWPTFLFCPWCGRARPNGDIRQAGPDASK